MNLQKLILTENACYKAGRKISPKGIMVHSTGVNNPNLKRYVGPDDGKLGKNLVNNHWNKNHPDGREVCVHAFIGKLKDGSIATYQTLPWDHRGWHAGSSANSTHIGFEICEDNLKDAAYFSKVYKEAVELTAMLCKMYNLDPMADGVVIDHSEGYARGVASNHGDVSHWFPKHGKSMNTFRADVKEMLAPKKKTVDELAQEVLAGKHGNGEARRKSLGDQYDAVQKRVNELLSPQYIIHTVSYGDTLWKIAEKYLGKGGRYPEIVRLNGLKSTVIRAGQKLKIPKK